MRKSALHCFKAVVCLLILGPCADAATIPKDPGVRGGSAGAGGPLPGISSTELAFFNSGSDQFQEVDSVKGAAGIPGTDLGLGPAFNLDGCGGCHAQPAVGGTSPKVNPQVAMAGKAGATNVVPPFITSDGPVREARFKFNANGTRDGGVHALYTIKGRLDAGGCLLAQPDFARALQTGNIIFRIPTPVFGGGLIEAIPDSAILANAALNEEFKELLHISGHTNNSGNDGTVTRFGWKAQNKSLEIFSGEAYNVEQGVTNELFPQERNAPPPACLINRTPETGPVPDAANSVDAQSDVAKFAAFMRFLGPPAPVVPASPGGNLLFAAIGCALCHTPTLMTGNNVSTALRNKPVNLFSDLLLHNMGTKLADDIVQGAAGPDEFRTAPLWGLGQRIFFLHDGRTTDLLEAIRQHSSPGSEANSVIALFNALPAQQQQAILDFLRSL